MIQRETVVRITDNSGARLGRVFNILGSTGKRYAQIGDVVVLSVRRAEPRKSVKKKQVMHAVVVRQKRPFRRWDGSYIRFDENAVVLLEKGRREPIAGRIFGPIPRELSERGYQKIASQAPEVI